MELESTEGDTAEIHVHNRMHKETSISIPLASTTSSPNTYPCPRTTTVTWGGVAD